MKHRHWKTPKLRTILGCVIAAMVFAGAAGPVAAAPQSDGQKTSDDQKNDKDDVRLTAKIRRAILHEKTLSMAARNIRIISANGAVTLRGEVSSEEEKATVTATAREIAGARNVTDELTVAAGKE
jgi:hyperosmotically inducible protein